MQPHPLFPLSARQADRSLVTAVLLLAAGATIQAGLAGVWLQAQRAGVAVPCRAPAAVLLILLAAGEVWLAWRSWRLRTQRMPVPRGRWRLAIRWLSVGLVLCYGGSMLAVEHRGAGYLFAALLAAWYFAVFAALLCGPKQFHRVLALFESRWLRTAGWSAYFLLMAPLCLELALRAYDAFLAGPAGAAYLAQPRKLPPGLELGERRVNAQGYWDEEFSREQSAGKFRIAAVAGSIGVSGNYEEHFLRRLERDAPDVEVYNFALPQTSLVEFASHVAREIAPYEPQLVLAVVSVSGDLVPCAPASYFDWRKTHALRFSAAWLRDSRTTLFPVHCAERSAGYAPSQQEYLQQALPQLAVCQTPQAECMRQRWLEVYASLDRLIVTCRERQTSLALVVSPGPFQVDPVLREMLRRRAGLSVADLDLDLPQRRLAAFARNKNVPLIDLLPHLQLQPDGAFAREECSLGTAGNLIAADVIGHFVRSRVATSLADAR